MTKRRGRSVYNERREPLGVTQYTRMVPRKGLEPPQYRYRQDLNLVRLPIPPPGQLQPIILSFRASLVKETRRRAQVARRKIKARGNAHRAFLASIESAEVDTCREG